jgi:signal transduction histidine kinase
MKLFDWKAQFSIIITLIVIIITGSFLFLSSKLVFNNEFANTKSLEENFPNYAKMRREIGQELIDTNNSKIRDLLPILIPLYALVIFTIVYIVTYKASTKIEEFLLDLNKSFKNSEPVTIGQDEKNPLIKGIAESYNTNLAYTKNKQSEFSENMQTIGHELKTPLAALSTEIDVLNYKVKKSEGDFQHFVDVTKMLSNRLTVLIDSLLILEKDRKDLYSDSPQDFSEVVSNVISELRTKASVKSIEIEEFIEPGIKVLGQRKYLYATAYNLIDNAIKYSNSQGKVTIKLTHNNSGIVFEVKDKGIGMSRSDLKRIFDRFFRSENARDLGIEGTGLGLAIVKKISDIYGWNINIKSRQKSGTSIRIDLK